MFKPGYVLACAHQWDAWWRYLHDCAPSCHWQAILFEQMAQQAGRAVLVDQARQGYFPTWATWNRITPSWWVRVLVRCTRWLGPDISCPLWQVADQSGASVTYRFVLRYGTLPTIDQVHYYGSFEAAAAEIERKSNQLAIGLLLLVGGGILGQTLLSFWCALLAIVCIPLLVWHTLAFATRDGSCIRSLLLLLGIGLLSAHWLWTLIQMLAVLTTMLSRTLL